ncbi:MAG: CopG family antitoxin [Anaerolineae bacterium]
MAKRKIKIPEFKSYKEEAEWWDTHDVSEIEGLEVVQEEIFIKPKKQIVSIRLDRRLVDLLKHIAQEKGIGYTTLVRMWVIEKLREHQKAARD